MTRDRRAPLVRPLRPLRLRARPASSSRRRARRGPAIRCPGLTPPSSRSSGSGSTTSSRSRPRRKDSGPAFNGTSCAVCHNVPAIGGIERDRRSARRPPRPRTASSRRSTPTGETLVHLFSLPDARLPAGDSRPRPTSSRAASRSRCSAPAWSRRSPTRRILALEDPDRSQRRRRQRPRAPSSTDRGTGERRVGRFGWKAQHATLLAFGADAYRNEMGITNDLFPRRGRRRRSTPARMRRLRSDPRPRGHPRSADAPARHRQLRQLHALAGAGRARAGGDDGTRDGRAGLRARSAAPTCHVPSLTTGPQPQSALRSPAGGALLGSAAARRRHRRRHRAGGGRAERDSHAGAVGPAAPPAAPARRERGDDRGRDPAPRRRGRPRPRAASSGSATTTAPRCCAFSTRCRSAQPGQRWRTIAMRSLSGRPAAHRRLPARPDAAGAASRPRYRRRRAGGGTRD